MITIERVEVWGFEHAIRGMRNPMNSWDKSDSYMGYDCKKCGEIESSGFCEPKKHDCKEYYGIEIGPNDLDLMRRLYNAGPEHRKYLRQIFVSMDITAPLYWWKEFDTYKVGTVANSCSTMHKIAAKEFELNDFSWGRLLNTGCDLYTEEFGNGSFARKIQPLQLLTDFIIPSLNVCRTRYLETKDKDYWWQMIQLLPSSYNQKRTVTMNYENVITIIKQRTGHKLDEWNELIAEFRNLPYIEDIDLKE